MLIEVEGLTKYYGDFPALVNVNLRVDRGIIFGLLGPNGSGKTTLIKAMVGALKPTSGWVRVMGMDPLLHRRDLSRYIGYMPQSYALYEDLTVEDNIRFFAQILEVDNLEKRILKTLQFVELTDRVKMPVYALSGGLKRRVSFAIAVVHDPDILFLDEPTAAVDPYLREKFWRGLKSLKESGKTIFVSTHLMEEAVKCDIIGILFRGRLLMISTPQELFRVGRLKVELHIHGDVVRVDLPNDPQTIAGFLKQYGLKDEIKEISFRFPDLDEIIISIFRRMGYERSEN
ncbi:MAG: ABC transporter ATP-binding protein [Thermotogae bacterium]|nr:ABC transporter ATP-binding protein [Thermotogota bacterium]